MILRFLFMLYFGSKFGIAVKWNEKESPKINPKAVFIAKPKSENDISFNLSSSEENKPS